MLTPLVTNISLPPHDFRTWKVFHEGVFGCYGNWEFIEISLSLLHSHSKNTTKKWWSLDLYDIGLYVVCPPRTFHVVNTTYKFLQNQSNEDQSSQPKHHNNSNKKKANTTFTSKPLRTSFQTLPHFSKQFCMLRDTKV